MIPASTMWRARIQQEARCERWIALVVSVTHMSRINFAWTFHASAIFDVAQHVGHVMLHKFFLPIPSKLASIIEAHVLVVGTLGLHEALLLRAQLFLRPHLHG